MASHKKLDLLLIPLVCLASVAITGRAASSAQGTPADEIRAQLTSMLQGNAPIAPIPDIPGGADAADVTDAAWFAWQEFVALSWANVPVDGSAAIPGSDGGPSPNYPARARETADASKKFGEPASPGMVGNTKVSHPALVWESARHRAEFFPGYGVTPNGYVDNANVFWGYDALPEYKFVGQVTPAMPEQAGPTPWVNLDETSQIGANQMFTGLPAGDSIISDDLLPGRLVLFLAKATRLEYQYTTSRGWYDTEPLQDIFANTSGFVVNTATLPPPGATDGSSDKGIYVSLPYNTIELKAAWRLLTTEEKAAYDAGQPIPGGYHVAPIRYYIDVEDSDSFEYVDTVGALLGLHIIHKTPSAPYFVFATFEHADNMRDVNGNAVEDADGNLNANAFVDVAARRTSGVQSRFEGYVYPSTGPTPPPGMRLIDATTPNILTRMAFPGMPQLFIPTPTSNGVMQSDHQASYVNTRSPNETGSLPTSRSASAAYDHISVNRRRFSIPQEVIDVNAAAHGLIAEHGYQGENPWLNYKLVNVQWKPAGSLEQKTPGRFYGDTSQGAAPPAQVPIETFYLANSMIETNMVLAAFSGQFDDAASDGLSNTDFYSFVTEYAYRDASGSKFSTVRNVGDPFFNIYNNGTGYNMGGCMGCHGVAAVGGTDSSFIIRGSTVTVGSTTIPGFAPDGATSADSASDIAKLLAKHRSYFTETR